MGEKRKELATLYCCVVRYLPLIRNTITKNGYLINEIKLDSDIQELNHVKLGQEKVLVNRMIPVFHNII